MAACGVREMNKVEDIHLAFTKGRPSLTCNFFIFLCGRDGGGEGGGGWGGGGWGRLACGIR